MRLILVLLICIGVSGCTSFDKSVNDAKEVYTETKDTLEETVDDIQKTAEQLKATSAALKDLTDIKNDNNESGTTPSY